MTEREALPTDVQTPLPPATAARPPATRPAPWNVLRQRLQPRAPDGLSSRLLLLTVVFDSLMIAVDLFRYDEAQLLGWSVGLAPIEDLAWPVAAGLLLPSLWELFARPADDGERERSGR